MSFSFTALTASHQHQQSLSWQAAVEIGANDLHLLGVDRGDVLE